MKKKFIYILISISVLLLLTNIIFNISNRQEETSLNKPEATSQLIDSLFLQTISKFNLEQSWIKKVPISSRAYDSLKYIYRISLPKDLRPAVVLLQINDAFSNFPVELISDEKIVNSNTTLNILSNDFLKLQSTFQVNNELEREHSSFSIIVEDFTRLDNEQILNTLHSIIPLNVLLRPSAQSDSLVRIVSTNKKTYSVLIDNAIEGDNFQLKPELSKIRLRESIRYISLHYPDAQLYIIDDKSRIFNSAVYNYIRDEFSVRNIDLVPLNNFIKLSSDYDETLSLFKFYLESGINEKGKFIVINAEMFNRLENFLIENKQRGTKYYSPSEMIRINSDMH